ncbi:hypothetical protein VP01_4628g2 [Puccinia sorghi]|uniref:Uncharacterized protein n=1 Tax=Puccinia sorghi TaxID=27349 RepID=A0A0L6UNE3_9BASI|nr:hypothetical protein VP01_4628g2 [Puccinia sorghi]
MKYNRGIPGGEFGMKNEIRLGRNDSVFVATSRLGFSTCANSDSHYPAPHVTSVMINGARIRGVSGEEEEQMGDATSLARTLSIQGIPPAQRRYTFHYPLVPASKKNKGLPQLLIVSLLPPDLNPFPQNHSFNYSCFSCASLARLGERLLFLEFFIYFSSRKHQKPNLITRTYILARRVRQAGDSDAECDASHQRGERGTAAADATSEHHSRGSICPRRRASGPQRRGHPAPLASLRSTETRPNPAHRPLRSPASAPSFQLIMNTLRLLRFLSIISVVSVLFLQHSDFSLSTPILSGLLVALVLVFLCGVTRTHGFPKKVCSLPSSLSSCVVILTHVVVPKRNPLRLVFYRL